VTAVDTRSSGEAAAQPDLRPSPEIVPQPAPAVHATSQPPLPDEASHTVLGDLRQIAGELVHSRDLLKQLVLRDVRIRYKQAVFGFAWALLMPLVVVLAGLAMRVAFAFATGRHLNGLQVAAIAVKAVPWSFFVGCINMATPSLVASISLVTKIYFPREVLPLGAILAQTFDSAIGGLLIVLALPFMGVTASLQLLWVPVLLIVLWLYALAAGLFLSCANLFFRDVKYLVQVFLTFGIFITPVMIDASMFGPKGAAIIMLNPVAPVLEGLRLAVVEHHNLLTPYTFVSERASFVLWHPWYLAYVGGLTFFGLIGAAVLFHRSERRFAEII
jgi:ABC-type polysaccharide/polyol phosphate export permease